MTRRPQTTEALIAVLLRRLADWGHGVHDDGHVWMRDGWTVSVSTPSPVTVHIAHCDGLRIPLRGLITPGASYGPDSLYGILDALGAPDGAL